MTAYKALYENLLPKFRSYEIPVMTEEECRAYLHDFLLPAISRFHVCRKNLSDRDDEAGQFAADLDDTEIEILSNYMLLEYIDSVYLRTPTLLKASLSSKDFNSYSPANMLDKLLAMRERYVWENESLLARYAWAGAKEYTDSWKWLRKGQ